MMGKDGSDSDTNEEVKYTVSPTDPMVETHFQFSVDNFPLEKGGIYTFDVSAAESNDFAVQQLWVMDEKGEKHLIAENRSDYRR